MPGEAFPEFNTEVEWQKISVHVARSGTSGTEFYKAWKAGHPMLCGYGVTLNDAITAMLNKFGEG